MRKAGARRMVISTALSYLGFIACWGIAQVLPATFGQGWRLFSLLFFYVVSVSIAGIMAPLYLADQFGFTFHEPVSRRRMFLGVAVLGSTLIVGGSAAALPMLMQGPPPVENAVRYFLVLLPIALGICFQSCLLIPRTVETLLDGKLLGILTAVLLSALSFGLAFMVDSLFSDIGHALLMTGFGLLFGLAAVLTRSVYLTFPVMFVVVIANTAARVQYREDPWGPLVAGFGIFLAALTYALLSREPRRAVR